MFTYVAGTVIDDVTDPAVNDDVTDPAVVDDVTDPAVDDDVTDPVATSADSVHYRDVYGHLPRALVNVKDSLRHRL